MQLTIGETYARKYRIARVLGEGSMGAVYEAENVLIRRRVAIKVLHAHIAKKADTLLRFEKEAQAAGRIGSTHIVEVLDMGELLGGDRFMVMEFLEGTTLDKRIRSRGRLTPEEATPIIVQLLEGLDAAHRADIIHRDLKPANVFLMSGRGPTDFVKILDFGVSKFNALNDEMSMTSTGAVLGTPYYMSPEQAKGSRQIDSRSDLYAVGVILYECITGQVPFSAETFNELIFRIVLESPPPVESYAPNLDPDFAAIIHKSMAREPRERFQTAAEFQDALKHWFAEIAAGPAMPLRPPAGVVGPVLTGKGTLMIDQHPSILDSLDSDTAPTLSRDRKRPPAWMPLPPPGGITLTEELPVAPTSSSLDLPPGTPPTPAAMSLHDTYVPPKQSGGSLAFLLGLIGVLLLGGGAVAVMKWQTARETAAAAARASAVAAEAEAEARRVAALPQAGSQASPGPAPPPPPPPEPSSVPEPEPSAPPAARTTSPVAVAPRPAPVSRPAARGAKAGEAKTGDAKTPAAPKSTAPPPSTAAPGKRTISNEL